MVCDPEKVQMQLICGCCRNTWDLQLSLSAAAQALYKHVLVKSGADQTNYFPLQISSQGSQLTLDQIAEAAILPSFHGLIKYLDTGQLFLSLSTTVVVSYSTKGKYILTTSS